VHLKPIAACLIAFGCLTTTMKGQNKFYAPPALYSDSELRRHWRRHMARILGRPDDGPHAYEPLPQSPPAGGYRDRCS
jgi:hypothetical protein